MLLIENLNTEYFTPYLGPMQHNICMQMAN